MNRKFQNLCKVLLFVVLISMFLAGCAGQTTPAVKETVTVRMGTQPWIGYGPWYIAQEKKMFEKYGLAVELINFSQDQDVNAALASGKMEAANLATHTAVNLYSKGLDIRIAQLEDASLQADAILSAASIASVADLKGKKVAYEEGTTSDLLLNYALTQNGMALSDIEPVPMPASDAGLALVSGQVDAAVTYEPYITEAVKGKEGFKVLYTAAERQGLISDVCVFSSAFLKDQPQAAADMLKAWDEAVAFYRSNPDDAKAIIATAVGSKPEDLATAFDGVEFFTTAEYQQKLASDFPQTLDDVVAAALQMGLLEKTPDLKVILDSGIAK
jgi:NitT/TauT family transport system substrate-binding protein